MSDIHIKPSHRGRLTELKARTGKSEAELYNDGNPAHKKMVVFARNARKWNHADGGFLIPPKKRALLDRINSSRADFVQRIKDPNRAYITNPDGTVSTHRLAYATDGNDAIVYPEIQNIGGSLVEVPRDMAYQSAVDGGDTLHMTPKQAKWFTKNYKKYYPGFKRYDLGGNTQDSILYDYLQSQGNPMGDTLLIQPQGQKPMKVVKTSGDAPDPVYMPVIEPVVSEIPSLNVAERMQDYYKKGLALNYLKNQVLAMKENNIKQPVAVAGNASEYAPSEDLIQYIMSTENFLDRPDNSLDGHWTIGYGDTDKALNDYYLKNKDKKYTKAEAEKRLRERVANEFVGYAKKYTPNWDKLTPAQKDSLVSYIYNIGPGTYKKHKNLFKHLENMDLAKAAAEINAGWNQKDKKGRLMTGLRKRRIQERQAFLYPEITRFGQMKSLGGMLEKMDDTYEGNTQAMLDAVRRAKSTINQQE